jgi:hypothetical protein
MVVPAVAKESAAACSDIRRVFTQLDVFVSKSAATT